MSDVEQVRSAEDAAVELVHPSTVITSNQVPIGTPVDGHYTKQIGSGENARNSFIYITIRWSFIIAAVTSGAIYIKSFAVPEVGVSELIDSVKGVWSIFIPIITLALGYSFGKGR
ncbi:hypothetical protein [Pseudomonas viridiflava]|uniref:hypothetical protein n=1 Tax=Pseudomonas viridiflava TaxID=33069 RepID=UPI001C318A24|nr:hypothetical protein [Pseudomonas viridiflava]QXG35528.1 hypothetical protein KTT61_26400 [Pseudomonas viridiflava]